MVANRRTDLVFTPRKTRKPTKKQERATRDLANKQAAWNATYGAKPTGFQFESTAYERQLGYAAGHPRVNYLAMSETELEKARRNTIDTDKQIIIDAAFRVVRMQLVIDTATQVNVNRFQLGLLQREMTQLRRSYAESTLQDRIDASFLAKNDDEEMIVQCWRAGYDHIIDGNDIEYTAEHGDRYIAITERLSAIRKHTDKPAVEPDHDLNSLRVQCGKYSQDVKRTAHVLPENLLSALKALKPAINHKSTFKVLGNVFISNQIEPGYLVLQATNLEIGIVSKVHCAQETPYIHTTVPLDTLCDYVALEDTDKPIRLLQWSQGKVTRLSVMQDRHYATFGGIQTSEFPVIPPMPDAFATIADVKTFKAHCKTLAASVYKEDKRPILTGVNVDYTADGFAMAASDSYKVVERTVAVEGNGAFGAFIVPGHTMATLAKIVPDDVTLTVARDDKRVWFSWDNTTLYSQLIDGKFPQYKQIVPTTFDVTGKVDLDQLQKAVKSYKGHEQVSLAVSTDTITSEFRMANDGTEAKLDCQVDGNAGTAFKAAFNVKLLTGIVNEIIKANPRGTVAGITKTGKATRVKDKSARFVTFGWNAKSHMLVLTFNGAQNTLMAIVPIDDRPASKFDVRDNDYWWQYDTNDYTAEANRYTTQDAIPPAGEPTIPPTAQPTADETPDPTGWYRRSLQQAAAQQKKDSDWLIQRTTDEYILKDRELSHQLESTREWIPLMNTQGKRQAVLVIATIITERQRLSDEFDTQMAILRRN
jgi:DNA polymerase III subunit beta